MGKKQNAGAEAKEAGPAIGPQGGESGGGDPAGTVKARFRNTYIGTLGNYYAGNVYFLSAEAYGILRADCEEAP